jgi:FMN phosphatase YigB (HAD superfamily)
MIQAIVSDYSRVILFPNVETESLNGLYKKLKIEDQNFHFLKYFSFNNELLDVYKTLQETYPLYILTSDSIQNDPDSLKVIKPIFKAIFSAKEYGLDKTSSQTYTHIAHKICVEPESIVYIDDQLINVNAAKKAGFRIIHFSSNDQAIREVQNILR